LHPPLPEDPPWRAAAASRDVVVYGVEIPLDLPGRREPPQESGLARRQAILAFSGSQAAGRLPYLGSKGYAANATSPAPRARIGLTESESLMPETETYLVTCPSCEAPYDALAANWCQCLVSERSLACPACGACFCRGPLAFKQKFWREAPKPMWERKFQEHNARADSGASVNPPPEEARRPLVLLVEDEAAIQRVAVMTIAGLGYGLVVAQDGEEGLDLARRYKPDLILTDALMPKLDGREMCRQLKEDPEYAQIKMIVMTSLYTNLKYHHEAFKTFKVDGYLNKPLDYEQLKALLQEHLG
jgi:CheY-like chemotaxis protein